MLHNFRLCAILKSLQIHKIQRNEKYEKKVDKHSITLLVFKLMLVNLCFVAVFNPYAQPYFKLGVMVLNNALTL